MSLSAVLFFEQWPAFSEIEFVHKYFESEQTETFYLTNDRIPSYSIGITFHKLFLMNILVLMCQIVPCSYLLDIYIIYI